MLQILALKEYLNLCNKTKIHRYKIFYDITNYTHISNASVIIVRIALQEL